MEGGGWRVKGGWWRVEGGGWRPQRKHAAASSSSPSLRSSLELSDIKVYEPSLRARLQGTAHLCKAVVPKPPLRLLPVQSSRVLRFR